MSVLGLYLSFLLHFGFGISSDNAQDVKERLLLKPMPTGEGPGEEAEEVPWNCLTDTETELNSALKVRGEFCRQARHSWWLVMDYWRAGWEAMPCAKYTKGAKYYPFPCYLSFWKPFWEKSRDFSSWCWRESSGLPLCAITIYAALLRMLKQADLWDMASALFVAGEKAGFHEVTNWRSVYQTPWFVGLLSDGKPFTPAISTDYRENVAPEPIGPGLFGWFDVEASDVLRPIANAIQEVWTTIRSEFEGNRANALLGPNAAHSAGQWVKFDPEDRATSFMWWQMGRAAVSDTSHLRLWGGFPGYEDNWWNDTACAITSPTLCAVLKKLLPITERPVPEYVTKTHGRWEFVQIYRKFPGANTALHSDPTRCFWQVCLSGCETAWVQVGASSQPYIEGKMVAFDATFDHAVVTQQQSQDRVIIHASMHYCRGGYIGRA